MTRPEVALRHVRASDFGWLTRTALRREFMGVQYSWFELPLQGFAAPLRSILGPFVPACLVLLDGERVGYVGRSPLSGNIEYFICGRAQGRGVGRRAILEFFAHHRAGDRPRRLVVRKHNERSMRALLAVFEQLGWAEGADYRVTTNRFATVFRLGPG